ncbi:hypothetical protein J6590_081018 [Homalodisca vitripennis]|nr:hypothetical protein J6590_081018 [Homalodisca vitripennis]
MAPRNISSHKKVVAEIKKAAGYRGLAGSILSYPVPTSSLSFGSRDKLKRSYSYLSFDSWLLNVFSIDFWNDMSTESSRQKFSRLRDIRSLIWKGLTHRVNCP